MNKDNDDNYHLIKDIDDNYHLIKDDDDETVMNRGLEVLEKKWSVIIIWSKIMMDKEMLMEKWWAVAWSSEKFMMNIWSQMLVAMIHYDDQWWSK